MGSFTKEILETHNAGYKHGGPSPSWNNTDSEFGNFVLSGTKYFNDDYFRFINVSIPQGATITSAKISLRSWFASGYTVKAKFYGIAEDNTADFSSDPSGRSLTSANVAWDEGSNFPSETYVDTADLTSIVQEIVNRGSWASGNAMGFKMIDNGMVDNADQYFYNWDRWHSSYASGKYPVLTITYSGNSPSASTSPSSSASSSTSASISPSSSVSPSHSASPSTQITETVLRVGKPGVNILKTNNPTEMIFSSEYGTLKYFTKQAINLSFDASSGDISAKGQYAHNLGYYPYVEVYVRVYTGSTPTGDYEYCPFFGSGASIAYSANVKIDQNNITVYGEIAGVSSAVWHFDFLIFVYKNNLNL